MDIRGKGYRTKIDDIRIIVGLGWEGWAYVICRDKMKIDGHDPVGPENDSEDGAKLEAVERALLILQRADDPRTVSESLAWEPYGPGH